MSSTHYNHNYDYYNRSNLNTNNNEADHNRQNISTSMSSSKWQGNKRETYPCGYYTLFIDCVGKNDHEFFKFCSMISFGFFLLCLLVQNMRVVVCLYFKCGRTTPMSCVTIYFLILAINNCLLLSEGGPLDDFGSV